jgi:hypothetical protein
MRWKSTLALVLLAAAAGAVFFWGDDLAPKVGITPAHPEPPQSSASHVLDSFDPGDITYVKVAFPAGDSLEVTRPDAASPWRTLGNFPLRDAQVRELVEVLGSLRTRFHAKSASADEMKQYGFDRDQKPLTVVVKLKRLDEKGSVVRAEEAHTLLFGNPSRVSDESGFRRPAYVRVDDSPDVLKLGPDVMPVVGRPAESYRRRQLFGDLERVRIAGAAPPPPQFGAPPPPAEPPVTVTLPGEQTETIRVRRWVGREFDAPYASDAFGERCQRGARGGRVLNLAGTPEAGDFTLTRTGKLPEPGVLPRGGEPALPPDRIADAWMLSAPHSEPTEPARLRAVLTGVADIWVERFVTVDPAQVALVLPIPFESPLAAAVRNSGGFLDAIPPEVRMGFAGPERSVTVKAKGTDPVTVRFGGVARMGERDEPVTIPGGQPGAPPRTITRKVPVEFRYARLEGSPQVFIVSAEKFDLFASVSDLADPRVARFEADEVESVQFAAANGSAGYKLSREKGDPEGKTEEEKKDRWFIDAKPNPLPADAARVQELVGRLAGLRAESPSRRSYTEPPKGEAMRVTVSARERRADGEPDAPARQYELVIGRPEPAKQLLPVAVAGRPRVSLVGDLIPGDPDSWIGAVLFPDTFSAALARPRAAYRDRKLFDTRSKLGAVSVEGAFALEKAPLGWQLTLPLASTADPLAAGRLATGIETLNATEFLTDAPTPEELKPFGLEKPAQTVKLAFSGARAYTLELGAPRPGTAEVFARLDGGGVFGLAKADADRFTSGALGLLPLKVWGTSLDKITALEVMRTGDAAKESFALAREGAEWKLRNPFAAVVPKANVQQSLAALANLTALRYHKLAADNPAEFGFDKPFLTIKLAFPEQKPGETAEMPVTRTLVVGVVADGAGRFARLDAPNAPVFVVGREFLAAAETQPLNLLDRSLLSLDPALIAKVRVAPAKAEDAFTLSTPAKGKWVAEGSTFAVDAERIGDLTAAAGKLTAARIAAYGDAIKWADYGLEKPATTVAVTLAGEKPKTHTIALGNLDPTGARFVRVDDKPAVGVLSAADAEALAREKFEYADRTLLNFDATAVVGLTRTMGKDELELAPGAAVGWDILKPTKQKADQAFADELAESLAKLKAVRVAGHGKKADVFKQFGLESPAATITVTVGPNAEQKTLRLGNPVDAAKPEGDRYAAVESASAEVIVGVLPAALAGKLLAPAIAFRDRTLAKFIDADKIVLERGDRKVTFTKMGVAWKVTAPLMAAAESAELEALVADLGKLRAETWVAEKGKDITPFGLDKPEARWTLSYDEKPIVVLLVGKKTADGRVHATTDKTELVGLLDANLGARVLAEYRVRRPWDVDAAQVESVALQVGGAKFTLAKAGMEWVDPAKPGDPIDVRAVNELIGTLGALRVERYAADKDADLKLFGLDKPEATLTVSSPTSTRVLEVGAAVGGTDGKQRYARVVEKDRTDVFVLSAPDTARLTRDRGSYVVKK